MIPLVAVKHRVYSNPFLQFLQESCSGCSGPASHDPSESFGGGEALASCGHRDQDAARAWMRTCKTVLKTLLLDHPEKIRTDSIRSGALVTEIAQAFQRREEALKRARMDALRENDTDAYLQHLSGLKLSSLLSIMEITHNFMVRIGAQLEKKGEEKSIDAVPDTHAGLIKTDEYRRFKEYVASTKDEYKLVHKKEVFVADQPSDVHAVLMPHQMVGLRFLVSLHANNINGILADEMGVGKTLQTLAFLVHLKANKASSGPHLVIAPLTIVREWQDAIQEFISGLSFARFDDLEEPSTDALRHDVVLIALHRVRFFATELQQIQWDFVVVDEAHRAVSNPKTLTAIAVTSIPCKHRLVLTGTPLNSDIQELWALLNFINPDVFTEQASFEEVFRRPFVQGAVIDDAAKLTDEERTLLIVRMHQILRPFMLRRTKKDVDMNLQITHHELRCPLSIVQKDLIENLRHRGVIPDCSDGNCRLSSVITKEKALQSICNHPFMITFFSRVLMEANVSNDEAGEFALRSSGKFVVLDMLIRRVQLIGCKIVIFSHWLDTIDLVQEYLEWRGWSPRSFVILTGSATAEERRECVNQFRSDPETLIMLLSVKAGGFGLNLQVAYVVVMLDKDYTATNEEQAIGRVFRVGQRETVRAFYLVTEDPSESRIATIAHQKNKPRQSIIEGGAYNEQATTEEERQEALAAAIGSAVELIDVSRCFCPPAEKSSASRSPSAARTPASPPRHSLSPRLPAQHLLHSLDPLLAGSSAANLEILTNHPVDFDCVFRGESELPPCVRTALSACERPKEDSLAELGRGKRETGDVRFLEFPSEAYISRHLELGMEEEDIIEKYRREQEMKQRHAFCEPNIKFDSSVSMVTLSSRRGAGVVSHFTRILQQLQGADGAAMKDPAGDA